MVLDSLSGPCLRRSLSGVTTVDLKFEDSEVLTLYYRRTIKFGGVNTSKRCRRRPLSMSPRRTTRGSGKVGRTEGVISLIRVEPLES